MVRSPKAIAGAVGLALGNAPYSDSDRTILIDWYHLKCLCRSQNWPIVNSF
ncbi:MAG: hypothetical protein ACKO1I_07410 [Microcystis aeruginosa]